MPMEENELIERDRQRNLGAELLESVREMMANRRGREYRVDPRYGHRDTYPDRNGRAVCAKIGTTLATMRDV